MRLLREYIRETLESRPVRMKLNMSIPPDLRTISDMFRTAREELYIVGGAVRDTLLNKTPKDYDLATGATPEAVIDIVSKDPGSKVDLTGKSFGVVRVWTPEGNEYEIATFRKDIGSGRRPDAVEFTSIEDDVKRRDLTINALFYDMDSGEVVDYVGGIEDIKSGMVKAVGDPFQRFQEDKLRILRAARFAARLGSDLDPNTAAAILNDNDLTEVSPDRIRDEVVKGITTAQNVGHFLELLRNLDLYDQIFPGLQVGRNTGVNTKDVPVQLALMLGTNDPAQVKSVLKRMKYSNDEIASVIFFMKFSEISKDSAPAMKKEFNRIKMNSSRLQEFSQSANVSQKTVNSFLKFASAPPAASPRDLMSQGLKGPEIGLAMKSAESDAYDRILGELRKYIGILLEFECPERDAHGWGRYYEVAADDVPTVQEVLDCWAQNGAKMYERSMPLMYSPRELLPYREYERNRLRNNVKGEYYQGLKQSIADEGIQESLHITVGLNGIAKISEGNHRHEIAMELGLQVVPVTFHFYQEVHLTPPREAAPEKKIDDEFLKDDLDEDSIPYEERSPEEQAEIDRGVAKIMKALGW